MSDKNSSQKNWTSWHHLLHKEILGNKTLIPDGANLLIAVSGGQDSMALLNLINDMKTQHNWFVNVWHGDHKWHEKSAKYALELKSYCNKKNINPNEVLNSVLLKKLKLIDKNSKKLKILGTGEVKDKINIEADLASKSAIEKLEKIGGSIQIKK